MEALNLFRRKHADIHLVILDLTMPRLSGREVFQQLLEIDPNVRVLLASGYSAEHVIDLESDRILGFVGKPYRPDDLARQVRSVLDKPIRETKKSDG